MHRANEDGERVAYQEITQPQVGCFNAAVSTVVTSRTPGFAASWVGTADWPPIASFAGCGVSAGPIAVSASWVRQLLPAPRSSSSRLVQWDWIAAVTSSSH